MIWADFVIFVFLQNLNQFYPRHCIVEGIDMQMSDAEIGCVNIDDLVEFSELQDVNVKDAYEIV